MMSSHLATPKEGHMAEVLRIFAHLRQYHNPELVFDPSNPVVDELHLSKEIGPQVNLVMFRERKESQAICPSQGV
eukprot:4642641-Ditylum_brightwellii.AAC.1